MDGENDMELPKRKKNRLECYDYRNPGYYFITICTQNKENMFWMASKMENPRLTEMGMFVKQSIKKIPCVYTQVHLDKFVIMPNHVHLILYMEGYAEHPERPGIPTMIGQMKRAASKMAQKNIWQRNFYDHVIRNERDYQKIWQYIDDNPRKWKEDCFYHE